MSRFEIPANKPGLLVSIGWDTPMMTFFAQVERLDPPSDHADADPILLWIGGIPRECLEPGELRMPLLPHAELTEAHIRRLRADRVAAAEHGLSELQRQMRLLFGRLS